MTLSVGACVDFTGLDVAGGHLIGISVSGGGIVEVGDTIRLTAAGDVDGLVGMFSYDPVLDARWAVSDPGTAQLVPLPPPPKDDSFPMARTLVRGVRPGTVRVSAMARGTSGEADVRVVPVIGSIRMVANRDTIVVGDTLVVTATPLDAAGARIDGLPLTFDLGAGAQITSADAGSVRAVALTPGSVTVTAHFRRAVNATTVMVRQ